MISALVVSHNARDHLRHCLERLATEPDIGEIVVADNASQDGSPSLVRDSFPQVRLLELGDNLGFGAANNRAAEQASGDRLLLINSDAWLAAGSLEQLSRALEEDPRIALAAPSLYYPDGKPQFTWCPETGLLGEALQKLRNPFEDRAWCHRWVPPVLRAFTGPGWLTAACVLVRRQAFEAVGGFDESFFLYFEDVDLCKRLRQAGWALRLLPGATAFHVKGGSQRGTESEVAYRASQLRYYRRHRPAWELGLLRRKHRRTFEGIEDPELRGRLLRLLDD